MKRDGLHRGLALSSNVGIAKLSQTLFLVNAADSIQYDKTTAIHGDWRAHHVDRSMRHYGPAFGDPCRSMLWPVWTRV